MARGVSRLGYRCSSQLAGSGDEETVSRAALVLGKALVSISLDENHPQLLGTSFLHHHRLPAEHALGHLRKARQSAERVAATRLLVEIRDLLEGVTALLGEDSTTRDGGAAVHGGPQTDLSERVRSVGEIIKLASVRASENWS